MKSLALLFFLLLKYITLRYESNFKNQCVTKDYITVIDISCEIPQRLMTTNTDSLLAGIPSSLILIVVFLWIVQDMLPSVSRQCMHLERFTGKLYLFLLYSYICIHKSTPRYFQNVLVARTEEWGRQAASDVHPGQTLRPLGVSPSRTALVWTGTRRM